MPASLAALFVVALVAALLLRESTQSRVSSVALWLPVLWISISGSRALSQWIDLARGGGGRAQDGTSLDVAFYAFLIVAGVAVLVARRVRFVELARANPWLTAFLLYGCMAVLWSDFPTTAAKRWFKTMGHPVMALVILSDPRPLSAFRTVMKRCAFLLLPFSLLLIKYFPETGRSYSYWTGEAYNQGVTTHKNTLGFLCMVFGLFFYWNLSIARRLRARARRFEEYALSIGFILLGVWLLRLADSATSLMTLVVGVSIVTLLGLRMINPRRVGTYLMLAVLVGLFAEYGLDARTRVIELLGRDPTLTDRTIIWGDVLALVSNPLLGTGFESFWLGERRAVMWSKWNWQPNQAHSTYIEVYLDLGLVGVAMFAGLMLSTLHRILRQLPTHFDFGRFRLAFLCAFVLYGYTESVLKGVHPLYTLLLLVALEYPAARQGVARLRAARAPWRGAVMTYPEGRG